MFAGGTGAACTTADGPELAVAEPAELLAVTATTTVAPTSAGPSVYVEPVAAKMSTQPAPDESQRRH